MDDYSYLFKIILVGDANVGKTCLVRQFTKGYFPPNQGPTIGVDFTIKTVEVDNEKVKVSECKKNDTLRHLHVARFLLFLY
jgi:Ras-related protein Rab-30